MQGFVKDVTGQTVATAKDPYSYQGIGSNQGLVKHNKSAAATGSKC